MKKIADLEKRWKIYKYRTAIFYVFLALSVAFVIMLGIFIESKLNDEDLGAKGRESTQQAQQTSTTQVAENVSPAPTTYPSVNQSVNQPQNSENLDCRQVVTNRLNVRPEPNFHSMTVGHYSLNAIFCVVDVAANGMLKTPNGWVSGNANYSRAVNLSMRVDSGFIKHKRTATQTRIQSQRNIPQTSVEEVRVFDKPNRAADTRLSNRATNPKPRALITSQNLSKEKMIEFKEADFRNTQSYDTAIEIARFYYDSKNYDKSIRWALNASNADSRGKQKTESFIIYAKSLYLSGKKEEAIEVLTNYTSNTNAPDAIDTLNKMKEGII